ncbi:unnamed protein product [Fusarium graminearum]|nr:unnamed protein product [Fusarium graminearum]CAG2002622.1 unnamed protein product [Fusarium graminearum]CZS75384.1 unnamed protein product [Fusarium graminearum]VTO92086.1 unnamed protein product [Fusarium graminearum]
MNRLFGGRRQEPRRSSDDDYNKMQFFTPRGQLPAKVVEQQVREVAIDPNANNKKNYPHQYNNAERDLDNNTYQNFEPFEQRNRPSTEVPLYEVPINTRMNLDKKPTPFKTIQNLEKNPVRPRDRARMERTELNTPGAFRGVAAVDQQTGRNYGVAGVIYHPEGNPRGFARAPMEPLSREGRQYLKRFADDDGDHRVTTWPPRDEDGDDLALYEGRYEKVRASKPKPMPKSPNNKLFKK